MKEEETIAEFNARILDLANEAAALGRPIKEDRMVSKILRSLPQRFAMMVTVIEEMQDITKADVTEEWSSVEDVSKQLALIAKNLERIVKRLNRRGPTQEQQSTSNSQSRRGENSQKRNEPGENNDVFKGDKGKAIQCRECRGYGHIQAECANTLKKKKACTVSRNNNDSEEDDSNDFVAFTSATTRGGEEQDITYSGTMQEQSTDHSNGSDDEEITDECMIKNYTALYEKCEETIDLNIRLSFNVTRLNDEKEKLRERADICSKKRLNSLELSRR
ncbi:unnamed protein product [Rhodiola kirilowii]